MQRFKKRIVYHGEHSGWNPRSIKIDGSFYYIFCVIHSLFLLPHSFHLYSFYDSHRYMPLYRSSLKHCMFHYIIRNQVCTKQWKVIFYLQKQKSLIFPHNCCLIDIRWVRRRGGLLSSKKWIVRLRHAFLCMSPAMCDILLDMTLK